MIAAAVAAAFLLIVLLAGLRAAPDEVVQELPRDAPRVSHIIARLAPPVTDYRVYASDPNGDALTFEWTIEKNGRCGPFEWEGSTATWTHDHPDDCPHDGDKHPGTVRVKVSDGVHVVERVYAGGSSDHEPDPLYPPDAAPSGALVATLGGGPDGWVGQAEQVAPTIELEPGMLLQVAVRSLDGRDHAFGIFRGETLLEPGYTRDVGEDGNVETLMWYAEAGGYEYRCKHHPDMKGPIQVA